MSNIIDSLGSRSLKIGGSVFEEQVRSETLGNVILLGCGGCSRLRGGDNIGSGEGGDMRLLDLVADLEDIASLGVRDLLEGVRQAATLIDTPVALAADAGTVATSNE